jgi:hypothetical protein
VDRIDTFYHQLVEEALSIVLLAGVRCGAAEVRVDLWEALRHVFAQERRRHRLFSAAGRMFRIDGLVIARLAEAAYQAALGHKIQRPFVDVELAIWERFHAIADNELSSPGIVSRSMMQCDQAN